MSVVAVDSERGLDEDGASHGPAIARISRLIVAVKLEGQTYRELADGTTEDAIRMKVKRAEQKLAAIYHELEAGER